MHASHVHFLVPAVPNPSTWRLPPNPPLAGCRPANSSTFLSFPTENFGWQLYLTGDGFDNQKAKCKANNNYGSGGRMFSPRSLFQQLRIEQYFARTNPSMTQYWLGIKQSTIGSRTKYKYMDGISLTTRWVPGLGRSWASSNVMCSRLALKLRTRGVASGSTASQQTASYHSYHTPSRSDPVLAMLMCLGPPA